MLTQLIWTLRQEPRIRAVELTIGDGRARAARRVDPGQPRRRQRLRPHRGALDRGPVRRSSTVASCAAPSARCTHAPARWASSGSACARSGSTSRASGWPASPTTAASVLRRAGRRRRPRRAGGRAGPATCCRRPGTSRPHVARSTAPAAGAGQLVVDGRAARGRGAGRERPRRPAPAGLARRQPPGGGGASPKVIASSPAAHPPRRHAGGCSCQTPRRSSTSCPTTATALIRDIGWRSPTAVSVLTDITDDLSQVRTDLGRRSPAEIATSRLARGAHPHACVGSPVRGCRGVRRRRAQRQRPDAPRAAPSPDLPAGSPPSPSSAEPSPQAAAAPVVADAGWRDGRVRDDDALDLFLGSSCVGCARPGRMLCARCRAGAAVPGRARWPQPTPAGLVTPWSTATTTVRSGRWSWATRTVASGATGGSWAGCSASAVRAAAAGLDPEVPVLLVPAPSRPGSSRRRGYDPTATLVDAAARLVRAERRGGRGRRSSSRAGRSWTRPDWMRTQRGDNLRGSMPCPSAALAARTPSLAGRLRGGLRRRGHDRGDRPRGAASPRGGGPGAGRDRRGGGDPAQSRVVERRGWTVLGPEPPRG